MVKAIEVESIGDFVDIVFNAERVKSNHTICSRCIFRGQSSEKYRLKSSLKRIYADRCNYVELRLLENFKKYGLTMEPYVCKSIWNNMIIAQHHGIPTRFLDFSSSPLVALHFALIDNKPEENAAVWCVNLDMIHTELIPQKYRKVLEKHNAFSFTIDMLEEMKISLEDYNSDMADKCFLVIEPLSMNARIINQGSLLALLPDKLDPLDVLLEDFRYDEIAYKLIIPYDKIPLFRKQLDDMNITERTLMGDLDGLTKYLKRRYGAC